MISYPGFNYTFNGPDISVLKLTNQLSGKDAVLGSSSTGEELTLAGFGADGTPSAGLSVQDGNREAFNALVSSTTNYAPYYKEAMFTPGSVSMNGKGESGDSGGLVFDSLGDLVGMMDYQVGNTNSQGATGYLDFGNSTVSEWIDDNTVHMPEPTSLVLLGVSVSSFLLKRQPRANS